MRILLRKLLRDIWIYRSRTALVAIAILVGVVGVGIIGQAAYILNQGMKDSYASARAGDATLFTDSYDPAVLEELRSLPGIGAVQGGLALQLRINVSNAPEDELAADGWKVLYLYVLPDWNNDRINRYFVNAGTTKPRAGELALEQSAMSYLGAADEETAWTEMPDGRRQKLKIVGSVRDPQRQTASMAGVAYGYATTALLPELGLPDRFNFVSFRLGREGAGEAAIQQETAKVRQLLRDKGISVVSTSIPVPGKHWAADIVNSMTGILRTLGVLILLLATTLVVNTIMATLAGQTRQIGVMKVLGARRGDLFRLYLGNVLVYGLIALAAGLPLGLAGARFTAGQSVSLLNFDSSGYPLSGAILAAQIVIGLVVPLLAALPPILRGIRITEREAIAGSGGSSSGGRIQRLLERVKGLSRPLALSLRNTFRRAGRLALTLATLSIGGAIVVSIISTHASMNLTMNNSFKFAKYDVQVVMGKAIPLQQAEQIASRADGIVRMEGWGSQAVNLVLPDGRESADLNVEAPPPDTRFIEPAVSAGRWLRPGDDNAIVVDTYMLPVDVRVGDQISLNINGRISGWNVVGLVHKVSGDAVSYVNRDALQRALGQTGFVKTLYVETKGHGGSEQAIAGEALKDELRKAGVPISVMRTVSELHDVQETRFSTVLVFLAVMGVLLTVVAAIGLAGTMSLNVMERTREIGILRSIGAGDRSIMGIVLGEGALIGLMSWVISSAIAWPISRFMTESVGRSLFEKPLDYVYPFAGPGYWLIGAVLISVLASLLPALRASRLALRDVLSYE